VAAVKVYLRAVWSNRRAFDAFVRVAGVLRELRSELPWRPELEEAVRDAEEAIAGIDVVAETERTGILRRRS
jgi:hypothetical protein